MPRRKRRQVATPEQEEYLFMEVLEKISPQTYDLVVPEGSEEYIDVVISRVAEMFPRVYKNVLDRMDAEARTKGMELSGGIPTPREYSVEAQEEEGFIERLKEENV